jgi:hypothetical protein
MTLFANVLKLWCMPIESVTMAERLFEMNLAAPQVLATRIPLLAFAAANPLLADYREITLMVSEKVDAFGLSQRSVAKAGSALKDAAVANAWDIGRPARGSLFGPGEWLRVLERNVAVLSLMGALPMKALAPVHKGVTENATRLRRR